MRSLILCLFIVIVCFETIAQVDNQLIIAPPLEGLALAPNATIIVDLVDNPQIDPLEKRVKKAWVDIIFTIDDKFLLGGIGTSKPLDEYTITFDLIKYSNLNATGTMVGSPETYSMTIDSEKAKAVIRLDLTNDVSNGNVQSLKLELSGASSVRTLNAALSSSDQLLINQYIDDKQSLGVQYNCHYGIDVRIDNGGALSLATSPILLPVSGVNSGRIIDFNWTSPYNFPNYEIQILRLHNIDPLKTSNQDIRAKINWNEALKVETTSDAKNVRLTIAEGTGFYVWRVRPIGNYFDGGFGDARNWGEWSNNSFWQQLESNQNGEMDLNINSISSMTNAFFLTDPDDNKNWMYSRVIVEENKVGEGMVYANNLLQPVQNQSYSSTTGRSIVSQTVMDYLGRPSLSTLPVPVNNGGLNGYEDNFFLNGSNELYSASDFDTDVNMYNPELGNQSGTNFEYYSSSNPDPSIPDAEGHIYSRTIFLPDGSGRVSESSGIGSVHAIGTNQTSKIYYATPSDDELIAIFGDEAPQAVNILKTITIDPNGQASISYTTIEGVTIATALSKNTPTNLLDIDNLSGQGLYERQVSSDVVINTFADQKIISSQVLGFDQPTEITIDYFRDCANGFDIGGCATGNCNFSLQFIISNIVTGAVIKSDIITDINQFDCNNPIPSVQFSWSSSNVIPGAIYSNGSTITLPLGNWKIQKVISSGTNLSDVNDVSESQIFLGPLVDLVANWMNAATNQNALEEFNENLEELITNLENAHLSATGNYESPTYQAAFDTPYFDGLVVNDGFPSDYIFHPEYTLSYGLVDPNNPGLGVETNQLVFSAACCPDLAVSVPSQEKYAICATIEDEMDNNSFDVDDVQFAQIFRELYEEIILDPLLSSGTPVGSIPTYQQNWTDAAKGYAEKGNSTPSTFRTAMDDMIYHMMTDQYFTGNAEFDGTNWLWETPSNGDKVVYESNGSISQYATEEKFGPYYKCDELYECWYASVKAYYELLKDNGAAYNIYDDANSDDENDAQPGGNDNTPAGGFADDPANGTEDQSILDKLVGWIISNKMKKFSDDAAGTGDNSSGAAKMAVQYNIPSTFLDCAGYKFAAIIDIPKADIQSPSFSGLGEVNDPVFLADKNSYLTGTTVLATQFNDGGTSNDPTDDSMDDVTPERLMYPNIMSPVWAFKYYEYNPALQIPTNLNTTNPNDFLNSNPNNEVQSPNDFDELSSIGSLELSQCYHDFTGLSVPFCNDNFCVDGGHHNWNASERYAFYRLVENAAEEPGINCGEVQADQNLVELDCTELLAMIDEQFDSAIQSCSDRADYFRSQIVVMLTNNCYEIVNCVDGSSPTNHISEASVDAMVTEAVNSCGQYVLDLKATCTTGDCSGIYPYSKVETCNVPVNNLICSTNERIVELFDPTYHIEDKLHRVKFGVFMPYGIQPAPGCTQQSLPNDSENCDELNENHSPEISAGI